MKTALTLDALQDVDRWNPSVPQDEIGAGALYSAIRATEGKALTADHIAMIERLLAVGVDVNRQPNRNGSYPLATAAFTGHDELVRLLLDRGATLFITGTATGNLLQWAAYTGMDWVFELFFERIAALPVDADVALGLESAFYKAAQRGHFRIVERLLDFGVGPDVREGSAFGAGNTALMVAAASGHAAIVELLRARGADIHAQGDRGMTVFIGASQGNLTDLALELLAGGADPNASDLHGGTPLYYAARKGNEKLARALLERGANLRARDHGNDSILAGAASGGSVWLIAACLQAGEGVDVENDWGYTPLLYASQSGHIEAMRFLVERGAQINHAANYQGETALHYAIYGRQLEAARWLVAQGADLTAEMEDILHGSLTPLMNAAVSNQTEMMEMLLQTGAEVMAGEVEVRHTALHYAASENAVEAVEVLLRHGADVNHATLEKQTPLMSAASRGNIQIATRLIESGAQINPRGHGGNTALHEAAEYGQTDLVELLLGRGADWQAVNDNGKSALDLAESGGHFRVVNLLRNC